MNYFLCGAATPQDARLEWVGLVVPGKLCTKLSTGKLALTLELLKT
jgi:hypothetical protein